MSQRQLGWCRLLCGLKGRQEPLVHLPMYPLSIGTKLFRIISKCLFVSQSVVGILFRLPRLQLECR